MIFHFVNDGHKLGSHDPFPRTGALETVIVTLEIQEHDRREDDDPPTLSKLAPILRIFFFSFSSNDYGCDTRLTTLDGSSRISDLIVRFNRRRRWPLGGVL